MHPFHTTTPTEAERLCDVAGRLNAPQLPLFRAAADGLLNLFRVESLAVAFPSRMIEKCGATPVCFMIAGDPGIGHPDHAPEAWACAKRLRWWCRTGGAIIHGAAGDPNHYTEAAVAAVLLRRLVLIETTSAMAPRWHDYLKCPRTLVILPETGPHPVPERPGVLH